MTINVNDAYLKQIADGITTEFNYDFFVAKQSDLLAFLDGVPATVTSITGLEDPSGGTFIISGPNPQAGVEVVATRELDIERKTNFTTNGDLTAALINKEFNYINNLIEQSEVRNNRSIRYADEVDLLTTTIVLAKPVANATLRTNADGTIIEFIDDESNPFNIIIQGKVDEAEGFADDSAASAGASAASAFQSSQSAISSGIFADNSSTFAGSSFSSALNAGDSATLASEHASNPEDVPIPVVGGFSALHYASKAQQALNQTFVSGGVFDPTIGPEYPDVTNVEVDTIWIILNDHTYVGGDLIGQTTSAGDQLFFDTPSDVFFLIKVVGGGVQSVNNDVGPNVTITAAGIGAALETRTINTQPLTSDVVITLNDLGYTGDTDANKYVHPLNATTNVDTANGEVIDQISTDSEGHITVLSKRTMTSADLGAAELASNPTFDNGLSTTMTILSNDSGESRINMIGASQGTGIMYVGQSLTFGGGMDYNGDNSPGFSGAGADHITIFRVSSGIVRWTARNANLDGDDWEFRGDLSVQNNTGTSEKVYSRHDITSGTAAPSGGASGDIYIQFT